MGPPQQGGPQQVQQGDPGAGRISFLHGDVSTQHSGSTDWAAATVNTPVVNGDHISTGQNARAEIQLDHANLLRLSDQTTANVVAVSRTQMQLQIGQGLANYDVFKNNEANIEIDTPNVAIHPAMGEEGSYRVLVNSDGETIVDVRKGSAEISTPQGSTRVERDQRITIQGNADSAQYQVSGAPGRDDWDRWNSDRDRTIEGAQSWQHTNPYYTGTQDLDTYGQWTNVPDYGSVWFPAATPGWVPYRDGRWVYEPYYGWTWVSYEPWGWAPYHYGRWFVYGGNWGWWPGPVYVGYRPLWAPAYVSFFGFGGGGWGVGVGFGGGFGSVGWLAIGPGDRFFPWYGRGINRVNVVNVYNIHNNYGGGVGPLREGPHAFSNVDRAFTDEHVRNGISTMQGNEFGHARVPLQQSRIDAGSFRQASLMTGAHPVSPTRQSFQSVDRQVNPGSIPNRAGSSQRFFSSSPARQTSTFPAARNDGGINRGLSPAGNGNRASSFGEPSRPASTPTQGQRGFTPPAGQTIQSSRPGWRPFTPPTGSQLPSNGGRGFEGQNTPQARPNYPQTAPSPRENPGNTRGSVTGYGSARPTLSMQQPIVTPRGGSPNSGRAPSAGGSRGAAPGGPPRGGNPGGASHGSSSGGGHNRH
jgi:hypothetical protein